MKKVVFVCTGNTCRSPMAEQIARKLWAGKAQVSSCGFIEGGSPMTENAQKALEEIGIKPTPHISKPITKEIVEGCDLVLTMTAGHKALLIGVVPEYKSKVYTLCEYAKIRGDIPDPYMKSLEVYKKCCNLIYKCIEKIDIEK